MSGEDRRRQRRWWVGFVVLLAATLAFTVVVGDYLVRLRQPVEAGRSAPGEWADLGEHGFRARLDSITASTAFPSAYDPTTEKIAPDGTALLRVRMTIEPLRDENIGCALELHNAAGENLTLLEYGVQGPTSSQCSLDSDLGTPRPGVTYQTQTVWVVVPEPVESYTLQLHPRFGEGATYWVFTP